MLTADVRFEGWTTSDWGRFLALFRVESADPEGAPRGGLVLVHDGGRLRKALHTIDGRIDPDAIGWPRPLEEIGREQRARWAWSLHAGALEELMERFGARSRRGDDALDQALLFFGAFRELIDEGAIGSWPRRLQGIPVPARAVVDRAIDSLIPPGRCALLALYAHGELWTSIVLRRAPRAPDVDPKRAAPARFDAIAGPSELRREMGLVSGEFRRDYRHLVEAVEALYAPVAVGLHAEVDVFRALVTTARPGDWARAVALRDVVVSPLPHVLAVPLGVDATRGALSLAGRIARQLDPIGVLQPVLRAMSSAMPSLPTTRAAPGFDPFELVRRLLAR